MNALASVANPNSVAPLGEPGLVRRFLAWMQRAPVERRAEAVSALARAFLYSDLSPEVRAEAVVALTSILDDPSAYVRRALAEAFASATQAPRHIVAALAADQPDVARIVLARSPVLTDHELVDGAAIGDVAVRLDIARRPRLGAAVAGALAEIGEAPPAVALAGNHGAVLPPGVLRRLFERFGDLAEMREALLARAGLPAALRAEIASATARALADFVVARDWLSPQRADRIARDAREQTYVGIAKASSSMDLADLVARLRESGGLTVALLLRALLSGDRGLFRQSLVDLSGLAEGRVAGLIRSPGGQGFAALYAKAGLPPHFLPAFRAALEIVGSDEAPAGEGVSYPVTSRLIRACEKLADPTLAPILSMLWRFAGESAREEAREIAVEAALSELAPPPLPMREVAETLDADAPAVLLEFSEANENRAPPVELDGEALGDVAAAA